MISENEPAGQLKQGLHQIALQKYKTVHAQALQMIKANVSNAVPYCLLATIAAEHGNHIKACELFKRAASLESNNVWYQAFFGKALTTLGHQSLAKEVADKAAKLPVDDAIIADTIGVIYSRTGFHENAVPFFRKAVSLNPAPANFHYNLAASQQFLGNFKAAEDALKKTLKRDPKAYRAWSSLVGLKRQTEDHNALQSLKALFEELTNNVDATLHLGHAIAKTLEDLGRFEESLDWLDAAKRGKRRAPVENPIHYKSLFEAAGKTISRTPSTNSASQNSPIFIIGLPRTGTTMVDRILSSHTQVTSAGELNVFPGLIKQATGTKSNLVMDQATLHQANNIDLGAIGQAYIEETKQLSRGNVYFTDKMPLNFFYAGLIHRALPEAKIIVLRRNAMDSCLSNYRQLLTVQHSYYQYTYSLSDIAQFYRRFDKLMASLRESLPDSRFMEIRYEDIVFDQQNQTQRLLKFCNLNWEEACLRFHENEAPVSTASSVQVRQPLYSSSIGRYKRYGEKLNGLRDALGSLADV